MNKLLLLHYGLAHPVFCQSVWVPKFEILLLNLTSLKPITWNLIMSRGTLTYEISELWTVPWSIFLFSVASQNPSYEWLPDTSPWVDVANTHFSLIHLTDLTYRHFSINMSLNNVSWFSMCLYLTRTILADWCILYTPVLANLNFFS